MHRWRRKKYNLRSAKSDGVQIPIQLQLSEDSKFLKNLLEVNSPGHAQQASDLNSSTSDLDCSGLLNTSEISNASTEPRSFDRLVVDSPSTSTSKPPTSDTQALINQTILKQLTAIGERLNKIEQKTVKKSSRSHKSKSRSAGTKNTKVVNQSESLCKNAYKCHRYTHST